MITFVYAQDLNGAIGYQNDLPDWHMPADLKFFKQVTMGHTMLMGRKTFESMDQRLLPGRKTVVMTSDKEYGEDIEGLSLVHSVEEVLELAKDQELMVIGGAGVFNTLMPYVDKIVRTVIEGEFPADTFMEEIDPANFELRESRQGQVDADNRYPHHFEFWYRKENA